MSVHGKTDRREGLLPAKAFLSLAVVVMIIAGGRRWGHDFMRLVWHPSPYGAVDLKLLYDLVQGWFSGEPIYTEMADAVHPPATYLLLWPFLGWLPFTAVRWLWAGTTLLMLGWLARLFVRASGAETYLETAFVALMLFSIAATGQTIRNGQLTLHVLPALMTGVLLLRRRKVTWWTELAAVTLLLFSLVKPHVSAPFFWLVLCAPGGLRPALLVVCGYVTATLLATLPQEQGVTALVHHWIVRSSAVAADTTNANQGNIHIWLHTLALDELMLPASLLLLAGLGVWTFRCRRADIWLLSGVAALTARVWTYHRSYDDVLILIPMVVLFRLIKRGQARNLTRRILSGGLLALNLLALLPLYTLRLVAAAAPAIWIATLALLLYCSYRETKIEEGDERHATVD